ncbi:MAG: transcriptional regulator, partial [Chlorobiales bacterium]|nr:transcriptional regulator [Chlorobiales bacterium]
VHAWMIWGVNNESHDIVGTTFNPTEAKINNQELESWLLQLLSPKINFRFYSFQAEDKPVVLLEIAAAFRHPVQFKGVEFIRIGSYKKKLKDYPEKERELWRVFDRTPFEKEIAAANITVDYVLKLLDYPAYFHLLALPLPEGKEGIIEAMSADGMIVGGDGGQWNITNLGAILFARKLADFQSLRRKAVRVVLYKNDSRIETIREQIGIKGYASGYSGLIDFITTLLPSNEVIGQALRKTVPIFPELAIRELVANALIHQDFHLTGTGPMVELFASRMEITNPGLPLVQTDRFLDSPPKSRNETLAAFMRRIGVCEERGSGVDKVVAQTELYQLPAPLFETTDEHTRVVLFAHQELKEMGKSDRVRACYLHACLRYVQSDYLTNASLRYRFGIEEKNKATASRYIREALEEGMIRPVNEEAARKMMKYVPFWA